MEEDIKVIRNIIYDKNGNQMNYIDIDNGTSDNECETFITAIEHLIKDYKEKEKHLRFYEKNGSYKARIIALEKENEDLKNLANNKQWISPCYVAQNYIPVSLVKEKIEELKEIADEDNSEEYIKIQVLQELLEKRK